MDDNKTILICVASVCFVILLGVTCVLYVIIARNIWYEKLIAIAQKKCKEYVKYACDNQPPLNKTTPDEQSPIILGEDVPVGMFPHMAYLEIKSTLSLWKARKCGGSLISEYFILSAAHCVYDLGNIVGLVKLGSVTRIMDNTGELFSISEINVHPNYVYNDEGGVNDIVLIKLDRKVEFNPNQRPICLNTKYLGKYDNIIATGWGKTEHGQLSPNLKRVELYIDQGIDSECKSFVPESDGQNLICAGHPNVSKSAHKGDSGGPLQIPIDSGCPNTYEQIGVTHAVQDLEIRPNKTLLSYYTKVELYILWIASNVWPNE